MRIQKISAAGNHQRPYGELLLLAGNTPGKMRTLAADLKILKIRPGQSTSHHFHLARESIYHVLEGSLHARSLFSGTIAQVTAGDTIIVDPGEDHTFTCTSPIPASVLEIESPPHDSADKFPVDFRFPGSARALGRFWQPNIRPRLKICGVRSLDIAYACGDLGVDAIGLHAVGPNWHPVMDAAKWVAALPDSLSIALLTDLDEPALVTALLGRLRCDTLQIQGNKPPEQTIRLASLAKQMGLRVLKSFAVPSRDDIPATIAHIEQIEPYINGILLDSHWRGGTGHVADVTAMRALCAQIKGNVVLAGGIAESNLPAFLALSPYAFDVESSVEWIFAADGHRVTAKSVTKIASLIALLRQLTGSAS